MAKYNTTYCRHLIVPLISIILFQACSEKTQPISDPAARVGDRWLSKSEVRRNIPAGVSEADSIKAANAFINNWVENEATMIIAERNIPDTEEINCLVENYRRELLMWEYRKRKAEENVTDPVLTEDQIEEYISLNADAFMLDHPIVKGIYIKIPEDAPELAEVIKLYQSDRPDDIDRLDKSVSSAVNYEYFRDTWMNWLQIEDRIPYDGFDKSPGTFPIDNKNLEHHFDGYVYLLHITEVIKPGNPMPSSYAQPFVIEAVKRENALDYDKTLRQLLTTEALDDGTAQIF